MGWRLRKTIKLGPLNINLSNKGVGGSVGAGGVRYYVPPGGSRRKSKPAESLTHRASPAPTLGGCLLLVVLAPVAFMTVGYFLFGRGPTAHTSPRRSLP